MEAKKTRYLEKEEVITWAKSCWEIKTRHDQRIGNGGCDFESCFGGAMGTKAQAEWAPGRLEGKKRSSQYGQFFQELVLERGAEMGESF